MRGILCVVTVCLALVGCANPTADFYQGMANAKSHPQYDASETGFRIFTSDNLTRDNRELLRRSYALVGQAFFNAASSAVTQDQIREQATAVGAHVVLVASKYSHTVAGAMPLSLPTSSTTHSTGTATAFGPAGSATAFGSSMTTTRGSQTVMVPYSVERSDFGVLFYAKQKQRVGIYPSPIDDATRRRLGTNAGISVDVVAIGSSAFEANVLPGDILLSVAGSPVSSWEDYVSVLDKLEGRRVEFELDRNGERLTKELQIRKFR